MINGEFIKALEAAFGTDNAEVYCVCSAYDRVYNWRQTNDFTDIYVAVDYLNEAISLDGFTPIEIDRNKTELLIKTQTEAMVAAHYACIAFECLSELGNKRGTDYPASLVKAHAYLAEAAKLWKENFECQAS